MKSLQIEQRIGSRNSTGQIENASTRKGRVVLLSTNLGVGGGAEEQVAEISLGLKARGWDVRIISLIRPSPISKELETSGIPIVSLNMRRGVPDPRALIVLLKQLRDFNPHIVHSHMTHANLVARAARLFHRIPVVINTLHSMTMEKVNGNSARLLETIHGLTDRFTDLTTVICSAAKQGYIERRSVSADRIAVLYNGVNTSKYQTDFDLRQRMRKTLEVDERFVWLAVGRFEIAKAYHNMIQAYARVIDQSGHSNESNSNSSVLLICGQGSLESELKAEVRGLGIDRHVRFLGVRKDVPQIMSAADGYVMSSITEGLPMVLLEASAMGLPIVVTSVGGNPEVVVDQENGYLVPPNDPQALALAMQRMMRLSFLEREAMGAVGSARTRANFDMQRILDQWEALYSDFIRQKSERNSRRVTFHH